MGGSDKLFVKLPRNRLLPFFLSQAIPYLNMKKVTREELRKGMQESIEMLRDNVNNEKLEANARAYSAQCLTAITKRYLELFEAELQTPAQMKSVKNF